MKLLLTNPQKTLGFVLPDGEEVTEIGLFDSTLIEAAIAALESFRALTPENHSDVVKLGVLKKGDLKCLAMRPADAAGEAWIMLAPRI